MPGAGGTGPQTQQQPNQMDDLREQLVQAIANQLHGGEPTAPQYQPATATPQQGFAMARNPSLAPMINQSIQAPGMAQYEQQKMAFEQAMSGRQNAMTLGAGMVNAQSRSGGMAGRPFAAIIEDPVTHERQTVNVVRDPSGRIRMVEEVGNTPWAPAVVQGTVGGQEGTFLVDKDKGAGGGVRDTGVKPRPTAGTVENISDISGILRNIDSINQNPLIAIDEKGEYKFEKRLGQEAVRALPVIGPQISSKMNPDVEAFESDIDNVRSRVQLIMTGKAVNAAEIKRLLGLIPAASTATNPEFFTGRMKKFQDEFTVALRRQARLRPDLFTPEELMSLGMTSSRESGGSQPSSDLQNWLKQRNVEVSP